MALYLTHKNTNFQVGDTIKVYQKITEGEKTRTQIFEGLVIKIKGHQGEKSFTVRKVTGGFGVEKIWPVDSPFIEKVVIVNKGNPSRAKLYYLRNRIGRMALKVRTDYGANLREQEAKKSEEAALKEAQEEAKKQDEKVKSENPTEKETKPEEKSGENGGTDSKEKTDK